jgi:lysophospholipase L1-like esterase
MPLNPRRAVAALLVASACTEPAGPATNLPPEPSFDPDVASWMPEQAPFADATRVVFLGDSITAGYGIDVDANAYANLLVHNHDSSWPESAGDDLTTRYGELEVVDVSVSGAETPDLLERQIPDLIEAIGPSAPGPTLIYVTIGGNDLVYALTEPGGLATIADDVEANLRAMAEQLLDPGLFPDGALLHVTNVYEPTDGEGQADECFFGLDLAGVEPVLDDTNARSLALAQELGFAWVDLRGHFRGHGFNHDLASNDWHDPDDPTLWLQDDCIHPNRRGHHELRRLFLAATDGVPLPL